MDKKIEDYQDKSRDGGNRNWEDDLMAEMPPYLNAMGTDIRPLLIEWIKDHEDEISYKVPFLENKVKLLYKVLSERDEYIESLTKEG